MTPSYLDRNLHALQRVQRIDQGWFADDECDGLAVDVHRSLAGQSAAEVERWLGNSIGSPPASHLAVVGVAREGMLRMLLDRASVTRCLVIEPSPVLLRTLLGAWDWSDDIERGRLLVVGAGVADVARRTWHSFACHREAAMLVNPRIARRLPRYVIAARGLYHRMRLGSSSDARLPRVRRSMLHHEVLMALEQAASTVRGGIVEIGAYVGGGTVALARGLRSTGHRVPFVSIEPGGAYPDHPHLPSDDILGDLIAYIRSERLDDRVTIAAGLSSDASVQTLVEQTLAGTPIGLLSIDADGQVFRDFKAYLPRCRAGALIVIDDYTTTLAPEKQGPTRLAVDTLSAEGILEPLGVYGWGTWFGTLRNAVSAETLKSIESQAKRGLRNSG